MRISRRQSISNVIGSGKTFKLLRAEQIIRPTGLLAPKIEVRKVEGQIDDLLSEVHK